MYLRSKKVSDVMRVKGPAVDEVNLGEPFASAINGDWNILFDVSAPTSQHRRDYQDATRITSRGRVDGFIHGWSAKLIKPYDNWASYFTPQQCAEFCRRSVERIVFGIPGPTAHLLVKLFIPLSLTIGQ